MTEPLSYLSPVGRHAPARAALLCALSLLTACESSSPTAMRDAGGRQEGGVEEAGREASAPDAQPTARDGGPPSDAGRGSMPCEPGLYAGTYTCENDTAVIREGSLELELVVSEEQSDAGANCVEFCTLVIQKGTGTIEGDWAGLFTFTGPLEGGLDCRTGAFEASVTEGQWGPEGLPLGTFAATFDGAYDKRASTIAGSSSIAPDGIDGCTGEISLQLQP